MKSLYLVRHGQTLFNRQKKIQGWCDSPLTELGVKQAEIAGKHVEKLGLKFDAAFSSTAERACDTLEIMVDMPYKRVKGLREWNFGDLEGEGEHLNPPLPYRDFFVQFGGEDEFEFQKRMVDTITEIAENTEGENILIVSHGAAIAQFYRYWLDKSEVRRGEGGIQNCSLFHYHYVDGEFILQEIVTHDFSDIENK
ncbi:histidine phosphatase family protein [Helcococcus kunzii]|uniref:Phosphoglycerate mutase n=1 Tax=Helcococcus kunzii ATCC 51366 TaxID=883114 RepID=H3NQC8_9FIRM|nr:histidine phosphatase family protein [Helcococcus kunzii]EHR32608.1 hypothetical protein HMPREF9709_01539 [Helcococcus kunzii ATCC 51366]MCT1796428.1 histidine phosphatase family protein [Helcococcus kunzii]MCT1989265.1 histidine phosphatase family protein [Helcococcus kunzii]QUY65397.1 histidine phosphatase family protein [Helcococcus kunzii]QZO76071.1 histidine phosphatase family protein [Helcococcus kunzii]